jgi:hypothetical protein
MQHNSILKLEHALATNIGKHINGINILAIQIKTRNSQEKNTYESHIAKYQISAPFFSNYNEQF